MAVTEAQKRATSKFEKEVYKKILVRIRQDGKSDIINYKELEKAVAISGKSLNGYILEAIAEKIYRDNNNIDIKKNLVLSDQEEPEPEEKK